MELAASIPSVMKLNCGVTQLILKRTLRSKHFTELVHRRK